MNKKNREKRTCNMFLQPSNGNIPLAELAQ